MTSTGGGILWNLRLGKVKKRIGEQELEGVVNKNRNERLFRKLRGIQNSIGKHVRSHFSFFWHFVKFLSCSVYKFSSRKDSELKGKSCTMSLRILQPLHPWQEFIIRKWKLNYKIKWKLNYKIKNEFFNNKIIDMEMNKHL